MSDLSPREKRLQLLEAISARLENMGVPASSTAPSGKKIKRTFANLCRQIEDQSHRAELQQIDFRAGFEIWAAAGFMDTLLRPVPDGLLSSACGRSM